MDDSEFQVSSELFNEKDYKNEKKNIVSKLTFFNPPSLPKYDADGDIIVDRKCNNEDIKIIEIEHSSKTKLDLVGEQLWRGALLLADWIINSRKLISNEKYILELGGGVGFASIVSSIFFPVIFTDVDKGDIFKLVQSNISRNSHLLNYPIKTIHLDFFSKKLPQDILNDIKNISIIIASDVIYDEKITDAFLKTINLFFMESSKLTVFVALEKRYVFTIDDLDTVAPCYEYFVQSVRKHNFQYKELNLNFKQ